MRYVYSVVRFVPDPARGEFVNIAAIVGSEESSEWQWSQVDNPVRARAIDDRSALGAVWAFLDRVGREMDGYERAQESLFEPEVELSEDWLQRLYVDHQNLVQLSPPAPMVAASAEEALERVFDEMIPDPVRRRHPFRKKHDALAAVRRAYGKYSVQKGVNLRERVALETLHHRERFDFAVTNGRGPSASSYMVVSGSGPRAGRRAGQGLGLDGSGRNGQRRRGPAARRKTILSGEGR